MKNYWPLKVPSHVISNIPLSFCSKPHPTLRIRGLQNTSSNNSDTLVNASLSCFKHRDKRKRHKDEQWRFELITLSWWFAFQCLDRSLLCNATKSTIITLVDVAICSIDAPSWFTFLWLYLYGVDRRWPMAQMKWRRQHKGNATTKKTIMYECTYIGRHDTSAAPVTQYEVWSWWWRYIPRMDACHSASTPINPSKSPSDGLIDSSTTSMASCADSDEFTMIMESYKMVHMM